MSDALNELVVQLRGNAEEQLDAATKIRQMLSAPTDPPIQQVIDAGVVAIAVDLLRGSDQSTRLHFELLWLLTNIASGTSDHCQALVDEGALEVILDHFLNSTDNAVVEQALWAIGNIAGDAVPLRDRVLATPLVEALARILPTITTQSFLSVAAWTMSNLCRMRPSPEFEQIAPLIPLLARLIYCDDEEILIDSLWGLSYCSDGENQRIDALLQTGVASRLVDLLGHDNSEVRHPSLRTIGNVLSGEEEQTQAMIDLGIIPILLRLLREDDRLVVKRECCWALSNITAGTPEQVLAVVEADAVPTLALAALPASEGGLPEVGEEDEEEDEDVPRPAGQGPHRQTRAEQLYHIRTEAGFALGNALCGGSDEIMVGLIQQDILKPLIGLLRLPRAKPALLTCITEALDRALPLAPAEAWMRANAGWDELEGAMRAVHEMGNNTLAQQIRGILGEHAPLAWRLEHLSSSA